MLFLIFAPVKKQTRPRNIYFDRTILAIKKKRDYRTDNLSKNFFIK